MFDNPVYQSVPNDEVCWCARSHCENIGEARDNGCTNSVKRLAWGSIGGAKVIKLISEVTGHALNLVLLVDCVRCPFAFVLLPNIAKADPSEMKMTFLACTLRSWIVLVEQRRSSVKAALLTSRRMFARWNTRIGHRLRSTSLFSGHYVVLLLEDICPALC
eukprot:1137848-Pelagomonas_calceolata.AAC.1